MSLNHYIAEIKKGLKYPVYLLYGESHFLLKESLFMTSDIVPKDRRDFCLDIYDMGDSDKPSIDNIVDILNTMPFLGDRRFVIIENSHLMKKGDISLISEYISNPSPYSVLIMLYLGKLKDEFKGLSEGMVNNVKTISVDIMYRDIKPWIREKARGMGINLTDGAVDYLTVITGEDAGLISSELEKIALLGKDKVDVTDLTGIMRDQSDYDVFDLIEAIRKKDKSRALIILRSLLQSDEPFQILGALNWYFGQLKEDDEELKRVFTLLHETDLGVKSSGGKYPLEYLFIRLLQF